MTKAPLQGVRVLDFTRLLPGPLCTMFLGDLGADVIKIEDTRFGDYIRGIGPKTGENSARFHVLNRNKRSLKVDFRQAAGRDLIHRLVADSQILVEGFRPGTMDSLGLGEAELRAINPALVYCSLSGFGQTGRYRDRAGHDMNYASYAGMADQIGDAGGPPANANFQFADLAGGTLGAMMGVLSALYDAERTGRGRYIDASITDCALAMTVIAMSSWNADGVVPERGNDLISGKYPWYRYYQCGDGRYVHLGALEWRFWQNFCQAVDRPEWIDKQMAEGAERDAIGAAIREIFAANSRDHWVSELAHRDTCVAPVWTLAEAHASDLFAAREMFVEYDHPQDGKMVQASFPLKMSDYRFELGLPPRHGEHTGEILRDAGIGEDELTALAGEGVIGGPDKGSNL